MHYHDSCIAGEVTIKTTLAIRSNAFCTSEPTFQSSHGNGAEIMAEEFLAKCKQQAGIGATSSELDTESLATAMPPVEQWNPPFCGDIEMRIARDGTWFYCGTPIARPALVRLFSMRKDPDGYVLATPVEKAGVKVEDALSLPWSCAASAGEAFEVPFAFLMDTANHALHHKEVEGKIRRFHAMPYGGRNIWGVTAGILRNLYERLYG